MRSVDEQIEGLEKVARIAMKKQAVNLAIQQVENGDMQPVDVVYANAPAIVALVPMDHSFGMTGRLPVLWETMVFVEGTGRDQYRYTSREAAIIGHNRVVAVEGGTVLE